MKKASLSLMVLVFAILLTSIQTFAQGIPGSRVLSERVQMQMRLYERLRLSEILQLRERQENLEVVSLSLVAQSSSHREAQIEILQAGRPIARQSISRILGEVRINIPAGVEMEELELSAMSEIFLESVTAVVTRSRGPGPRPIPQPIPQPIPAPLPRYEQQVTPHSFLTLQVNQRILGVGTIHLRKLVQEQLGLSILGAQIERVVVMGQPLGYSRLASVQVELNNRPASHPSYLGHQRQLPLRVESFEEVKSNLQLNVSGDAIIHEIRIRVGMVRPQVPEIPRSQRILVGQEVSYRMPLELSRLLGHERRLIRAITIEARSRQHVQAQLALLSGRNETQGAILVGQNSVRATLQLARPMMASELRLESISPVLIDALEIQFEISPRF